MAAAPLTSESSREEQIVKIHLFSGLRPEALRLVAQVAVEETHGAGTVIFKHGDVGEKLYVIVEGRVRITREVQGMGEEALAVIGPGDVFGEMALLDDAVRSADARVHERVRLLAIHRDAFEDLLFVHKDLAYEVLWNVVRMLTRRLRETNDKFAMLSFASKF
jgi:CRP/FNR family cyclic AMP-dependent transcriptional regulator